MRVSADSRDRDFKGNKTYTVTLDGEPVSFVLAADDEHGYIVVHRLRDGKRILNAKGDEFQREFRWGKVVITEVT